MNQEELNYDAKLNIFAPIADDEESKDENPFND